MAWDGFACCRQETETNRPLQADHFSHRRSSLFDSLRALLQTDYEKRQISFVYIEKNYYCVTQQNLLCLDISIFLPSLETHISISESEEENTLTYKNKIHVLGEFFICLF